MASGRLRLQLLGLFLDLLDFDKLRVDTLLVVGIATPFDL